MAATSSPTSPQMTYWSCHTTPFRPAPCGAEYQKWRWLTVLLETSATIRLPMTGPSVQNPMADARPTCGE